MPNCQRRNIPKLQRTLLMDPYSYEHHPMDDIEPLPDDTPREKAEMLNLLLTACMEWVVNSQTPEISAWQVSYALGLGICTKSMSKKGEELGVGYAAISKGSRDFYELHLEPLGLQPSKWMKRNDYAKQRRENVLQQISKEEQNRKK